MTISVREIPLATITGEMVTQGIEDLSSSFIKEGLGCSDGGGVTLAIAPGTARIGGYRAISDATVNQVLTDDSANYVYFSLTTDAQARVDGAEFLDFPTTQAEDSKLLISQTTCSGGSITTIIDRRIAEPLHNWSSVLGPVTTAISDTWEEVVSTTLETGSGPILIMGDLGSSFAENTLSCRFTVNNSTIEPGNRNFGFSNSGTNIQWNTVSASFLGTLAPGRNVFKLEAKCETFMGITVYRGRFSVFEFR